MQLHPAITFFRDNLFCSYKLSPWPMFSTINDSVYKAVAVLGHVVIFAHVPERTAKCVDGRFGDGANTQTFHGISRTLNAQLAVVGQVDRCAVHLGKETLLNDWDCLTTPQHKNKSAIGCQTNGIYIKSKFKYV